MSNQGYFREEIGKYIRGDNSLDFVKTVHKSSMEALERVCFDYLQFVRGETRDKILEILKAAGTGKKYGRKLERGLWWSQALAAYKLGMLRSVEWVPVLLKRLNSKNPDVCYNSAKARYGTLLIIETKKYLCKPSDSFCDRIIKIIGGIFYVKESLPPNRFIY